MARLRYMVSDDSGTTSELIKVFRGRRVVASGWTDFGPSIEGEVYWVGWRVPRKMARKLKFCVVSHDESDNQSRRSCAPLTLR
jgi:hypothetical protein